MYWTFRSERIDPGSPVLVSALSFLSTPLRVRSDPGETVERAERDDVQQAEHESHDQNREPPH